jgi:hypothetical protein
MDVKNNVCHQQYNAWFFLVSLIIFIQPLMLCQIAYESKLACPVIMQQVALLQSQNLQSAEKDDNK